MIKSKIVGLEKLNYKELFSKPLLDWYKINKRDLPWRKENDPYLIWISEIMLQQTQVVTVIPYYDRFIKALPTVYDLAQVNEQTLLKLWEGLGYYQRARNLKEAAIEIVKTFNGKMPNTYNDLIKLKGIGPYTAGAILSIAYEKKYPAVDGNVYRVLSRFFEIKDNINDNETKKRIYHLNLELMIKPYGDFTQALMELGSEVCKSKGPMCKVCPLNKSCLAFKNKTVEKLPFSDKQREKKHIIYQTFILKDNDHFIVKQQEERLLKGLYLFPQVEAESLNSAVELLEDQGFNDIQIFKTTKKRHIFTHLVWEMDVHYGTAQIKNKDFTLLKSLNHIPMATAHKKIKLF